MRDGRYIPTSNPEEGKSIPGVFLRGPLKEMILRELGAFMPIQWIVYASLSSKKLPLLR
jgi:hypothetical protein